MNNKLILKKIIDKNKSIIHKYEKLLNELDDIERMLIIEYNNKLNIFNDYYNNYTEAINNYKTIINNINL